LLLALFVAITATFKEFCNVEDGIILKIISHLQGHVTNAWYYFEAKNTKQSIVQNSLELLELQNPLAVND